MPAHVAFLRGMNLGGRRLTNTTLCAAFERLGARAPSAFLASGNVVFELEGSERAVAERVERGLADALGYEVVTFIRAAAQVRSLGERRPFDVFEGADERGKPQVAFLLDAPTQQQARAIADMETDDDWLVLENRELHWLPRGGVSASEFDFGALHRLVGPTTVRTHNTIARLAAKLL